MRLKCNDKHRYFIPSFIHPFLHCEARHIQSSILDNFDPGIPDYIYHHEIIHTPSINEYNFSMSWIIYKLHGKNISFSWCLTNLSSLRNHTIKDIAGTIQKCLPNSCNLCSEIIRLISWEWRVAYDWSIQSTCEKLFDFPGDDKLLWGYIRKLFPWFSS